ncbi:MAG: YegP family protein [Candidatus Bathyarchaeota archaeon]|nr:YegP family protein [Candidatus Bathyarchaeum sp.]
MTAIYQVYKDTVGKFRFRLRAENNKIVAVSEAYESKASCINGVKSVQKNCGSKIEDKTIGAEKLPNPKYEVFTDIASKFRFNLSAPNGEIIAASEAYETKQGCMNGIEAVQRSCDANIEDLTTGQVMESKKKVCPTAAADAGATTLEMTCPPTSVDLNTMVTFEGKLTDSDTCKGIGNAEIGIYEKDRSFMGDDLLVSGMTNKDGTFKIVWKAKQQDWWDDSVEVYAKFNGTEKRHPSQTDVYRIRVLFYLRKKK